MGAQGKPRPLEIIKIGKKTWRRTYERDPWNDMETELELFISPTLEMRLAARRPAARKRKGRHGNA